MGLVIFVFELNIYYIYLLAESMGFFHFCHSNNMFIISFNMSLRNNEVFNNVHICKLPMNEISIKKSKRIIIYSIHNNQKPRIDFIVSSDNYYKKTLIFSCCGLFFIKFFGLKYITFIILHLYLL